MSGYGSDSEVEDEDAPLPPGDNAAAANVEADPEDAEDDPEFIGPRIPQPDKVRSKTVITFCGNERKHTQTQSLKTSLQALS